MSYRDEFPNFPPETMPALPEGFEDVSWHNDAMPAISSDRLALHVWIDFEDEALREFGPGPRFCVNKLEGGCEVGEGLLETDQWDEVLALIAAKRAEA